MSALSLDGEVVDAVPAEFALCPYGVFTTFVAVDGGVLAWGDHVARLARDARLLWGHELDVARLRVVVAAHLARLPEPATVRVTLYPADLPLAAPARAHGCRILVASRATRFPFVPEPGLAVGTVEHERESAETKSTALLTPLRLRREAQLAGYDDVLFRRGGDVLEGATWAVLVWRDGEVATPADGVLHSITADRLGRVADEMGWVFRRRRVALAELRRAELVLAVNANAPARAVRSVDGEPLTTDADLLAALAAAYSALPRDEV
ncbi:aminotransferase class IV [Nocardioides sp.]|uniref:aminotransferase class IV n=1 Tax=Nocardioides sp. TaxID=35761 RepID=UPI002ED8A55B